MPTAIDICICTYRRASLADTIASIARQRLPPDVTVKLIIADNDDNPSAEPLVRRLAQTLGLDCLYVHAPARNIAVARNACLDAATAPLMAFIDDDEIATQEWLGSLLTSHRASMADVTFGPIRAVYPAQPAWLQQADMHSIRPTISKSGEIITGYTSNVMIDRARLGERLTACRFDPRLGRSGGEDTAFFHHLHGMGARLAFCPEALVTEIVTDNRANLIWLMKRAFRSGQTHGRVLSTSGHWRIKMGLVASGKLAYCLADAGARSASAAGWRRSLVRGSLHAGVMAKSLGLQDLLLY